MKQPRRPKRKDTRTLERELRSAIRHAYEAFKPYEARTNFNAAVALAMEVISNEEHRYQAKSALRSRKFLRAVRVPRGLFRHVSAPKRIKRDK